MSFPVTASVASHGMTVKFTAQNTTVKAIIEEVESTQALVERVVTELMAAMACMTYRQFGQIDPHSWAGETLDYRCALAQSLLVLLLRLISFILLVFYLP